MRSLTSGNPCILVVDDDTSNLRLLTSLLGRIGYDNVHTTTAACQLEALCPVLNPDLILLDLHMPDMDGFAAMASIAEHMQRAGYLPVLVLTGDPSPQVRYRALQSGAIDFLMKPYDVIEIRARVQNLLAARALHLRLEEDKANLEIHVRDRTKELIHARMEALDRLAFVAEFRDDETGMHARRVGLLAAELARILERPAEEIEIIGHAAPLHDIGKIAIPDAILLKPGKLDEEELAIMRGHAALGARMLAGGSSPYLRAASEIALTHHERWNGSGYPSGMAGTQIPLNGRIVAVADYFDALTHDRPYRRAIPQEAVLRGMASEAGRLFDPDVVEALMAALGAAHLSPSRSPATAVETLCYTTS